MPSPYALLTEADLITLFETARDLAAEVNYQALLQNILDKVCRLTDSKGASVILFNEKRGNLYIAQASGDKAELVLQQYGKASEQGIPLKHSKAGQVFTTGQSIIDDTIAKDKEHFKGVDRATKSATSSMVCVPLAVTGKNIGVLQTINKRRGRYARRDLVLLELFASQAAVAVRNAQLFNDLLAHMGIYASLDDDRGPMELLDELKRPAQNELLTIFFADMRGFSKLCEVINRLELTQARLNEFLALLANEIIKHGGVVNKFLGDGLMALFRKDGHELRAVECAMSMLAGFNQLRDAWDKQSNAPLNFLDLGIGIATDTVIVGTVGSERVREFTAVGVAVNSATRLMEYARDKRRVMVDKRTFHAVKDHVGKFEGHESQELKELKKAGQTGDDVYDRFHLISLKQPNAAEPPASAVAAPSPAPPNKGRDIFISYSHKDKAWLDKLKTHLRPYTKDGSLKVWDDTVIKPGADWRAEITRALAAAQVAVLLVSPNFLASDFIATNELPPLLNAAKARGVNILWALVSACSYKKTEIEKYQAALDPARPLDSLKRPELNEALVKLCEAIEDALQT